MKLSKAQLEVIQKMKEGWQLRRSRIPEHCEINLRRRVDSSFEFKSVNYKTWFKLFKLGLIKEYAHDGICVEIYRLTEEGIK